MFNQSGKSFSGSTFKSVSQFKPRFNHNHRYRYYSTSNKSNSPLPHDSVLGHKTSIKVSKSVECLSKLSASQPFPLAKPVEKELSDNQFYQ
jgi:hypothetical protein